MSIHEDDIKVIVNKNIGGRVPPLLASPEAEKAFRFHKTIPSYKETPLVDLSSLAKELEVGGIYVKDESYRFGLNSFKALGGTYAMAKSISLQLGFSDNNLDFDYLSSAKIREQTGMMTFITATDGNHGRGVAWAAQQLGQKAVVYLPKGSAKARIDAILETGADAVVTDLNYDDTVRLAIRKSEEEGWHLVQDTAWAGYTEIPGWIMQGYTTMIYEALQQLKAEGRKIPTHIFLQAGVGSMPAAVLGYLKNIFGEASPKAIIVEPTNAACIYNSAAHKDGKRHPVKGDLQTIMSGLSCGEPNVMAWDILRDFSSAFVSCTDYIAARGMRILGHPTGHDLRIISGESGAVGAGLLSLLMGNSALARVKKSLGLNKESFVLLFNTEGNTDPANYRRIVWDGEYPLPTGREITCSLDNY